MRNRLFSGLCFVFLAILTSFFIILIASIVAQLMTSVSVRGIQREEIFFSLKLTLLTATISSLLAVLIAIPVSYALSRYRFPFKNVIDGLLYLPIVVSPIALGAMLLIFFNTTPGRLFEKHVLRVVFEVPGIVAAQLIVIVGMAISMIKSTFESVNPDFEHIARTLGATRFQTVTRVLLPLSKNGIVAAFLLSWARAVGEFGATVTLAGATTMKTETLPVAIFLSFASADIRAACAFILISLAASLAVLISMRMLYAQNRKPLL